MSYIVLPYTKIIIPAQGKTPEKIIYSPRFETYLFHGAKQTNFSFYSLIDSGADFCVFPSRFGELMDIDIKEGEAISSFGVGGKETFYFHRIKVGIVIKNEIWKFESRVGFSYKMNDKGTGLLGREGFFDLFSEVSFNQKKKMFKFEEGPEDDFQKEEYTY